MRRTAHALTLASLFAAGCGAGNRSPTEDPAPSGSTGPSATAAFAACEPTGDAAANFERSQGGTVEVSTDWVARHGCKVRLVDLREHDELLGGLGHLPGVEWVPLSRLATVAKQWRPDEAVVFVCRSGRRSTKAAEFMEDLGYTRVASMTGGMLLWHGEGRPTSRADEDFDSLLSEDAMSLYRAEVDGSASDEISEHIGSAMEVGWVKAASLVMSGSQSCVDGRDGHQIIGTPGGDAGEFLLTMAVLEELESRALSREELRERFGAYLGAFGQLYMHTDDAALEHLGERIREDLRFAGVADALVDADAVEAFVRRPPHELEGPLLEHLVLAETIGCGHLKLMALHPAEYGLREDLVADFLGVYFRRLWRGAPALQYVSLHGEHAEGAVLNVVLDAEVHAFTDVPTIAPLHAGTEVFVQHPEVNHWVRQQHAAFLLEKEPWLTEHGITDEAFLDALETMGQRQLEATLRYLADGLPIYTVHFEGREYRVEGPAR